jgi:pilus assembly protein CpaF
MPFLIVQERGGAERRVELASGRFSIGKRPDNDLVLDRTAISREHCLIHRHDGKFYVRDLDSRNGTYVDGRKVVTDVPLSDGAQIQLGDFRIVFRSEAGEAPHAPVVLTKNAPPQTAPEGGAKRIPVDLRRKLHQEIIDRLDLKHTDLAKKTHEEIWRKAADAGRAGLVRLRPEIPAWVSEDQLVKDVVDEAVGLGPLEDLLDDETVDEVMVNGWDRIYVERRGKISMTDRQFLGDDQVLTVIRRILSPLGRRIDESNPMVDARLKDGSRVNAIIHPLSLTGPTLTIRKFAKRRYEVEDLVGFGTLDAHIAEFLKLCVTQRRNILVSGGTGSGKTTFLNVLSSFIPETERIVTIEDAAELQLHQEHVVRLESKPPNIEGRGEVPIRKLVINSLRMRPDRIIVGECRGSEALDMLQAMNTGHDGSLTTVHANSVRDSLSRLETMVMMAGMELPSKAIRTQVASAIHIFVHTARYPDGTRKVAEVSEMTGMEQDTFTMQSLFVFKQTGIGDDGRVMGYHTATGILPKFVEHVRERGIKVDLGLFKPRKAVQERTS